MHSENTPPNFSAKEQIIYEIAGTLQFFNYSYASMNRHTNESPTMISPPGIVFLTAFAHHGYTGRRTLFQYFSILIRSLVHLSQD